MTSVEQLGFLETLYSGLAKVFASPELAGLPEWLALPGREWPVCESVPGLAANTVSDVWTQAAQSLEKVPGSTPATRLMEYEQLFIGLSQPPIWLYEAYYVDGRILGPASFSVSAIYTRNGLEVEGSELPDHASVELAFLAFLVHQESLSADPTQALVWSEARTLFIKEHAGVWLPGVAKKLIATENPAWAAIGALLIAGLSSEIRAQPIKKQPVHSSKEVVPHIEKVDECILCGFCVQVCPTRALAIREDQLATSLWLNQSGCTHCQKCMRVCPTHIMEMVPVDREAHPASQPIRLIESPRATCPKCGEPTVSRAELDYVIKSIGHPDWLDYCTNCRGSSQKADPYTTPSLHHKGD